ncbi:hypothetical protein [Roseateles depolymerans]|uniref:Uncharacterized protein n=1 Tax=Roseateles depolymerans TaxID=76731 RepID=A0A0U3MA95_9BURK|nr:hypothetical protein [Roseateles depolymerans]ALV05565.1 hypothetical protein RD2015_1071 [Roseateles depolymerans]REG14415.1 hypothetical protein DES44_2910 [Roseateles depolymerans]
MNSLDVVWHLCNLFLPAWVVAALMAGALKLLWRDRARGMTWAQLALWGAAGGSMATVFAVLLIGRDGSMAGYAAILVGVTLPQWGLTWRASPNS